MLSRPASGASGANVIMGSAAPAIVEGAPEPRPEIRSEVPVEVRAEVRVEAQPDPRPEGRADIGAEILSITKLVTKSAAPRRHCAPTPPPILCATPSSLRSAISLCSSPCSNPRSGRSKRNSLTAKVASSSTMIDMSFTSEARRIATAAASGQAGRPIKVQVVPGGTAQASAARRPAANGSARSRAEQDPIVRRMQEKFGAEIRTVIDYREKQ